jgi:hypothetical protein
MTFRVACPRELHCGRAHATGRTADQDCLAGRDADQVEDALGGRNGDRVAGGLREGQPVGLARPVRQHRALGIGVRPSSEYRIAHGGAIDAGADLVHDAGGVHTDPGWQRQGHHLAQVPGADLPVHGVDADCPHYDANLTGPSVRLVDLDQLEHVRVAVIRILRCLHGSYSLDSVVVDGGVSECERAIATRRAGAHGHDADAPHDDPQQVDSDRVALAERSHRVGGSGDGLDLREGLHAPGILPTAVNTELANTSEKMGRKRASCALSGSATLSPMKANTRTKL